MGGTHALRGTGSGHISSSCSISSFCCLPSPGCVASLHVVSLWAANLQCVVVHGTSIFCEMSFAWAAVVSMNLQIETHFPRSKTLGDLQHSAGVVATQCLGLSSNEGCCVILSCSYTCLYLNRGTLTYTAPVMVQDPLLGLTKTDIGAMTSAFPAAYGALLMRSTTHKAWWCLAAYFPQLLNFEPPASSF